MTRPTRFYVISGIIVALAIAAIYSIGAAPPSSMDNRTNTLTEAETATVKEFQANVQAYAGLHQQLEGKIDKLSDQSTPEEIDAHRTALRDSIKAARAGVKRGTLFTPAMEALVRRVCANEVSGAEGKEVKASINDENIKMPNVVVNDHYPDGVPVTTMPAQLLEVLPRIPQYMEYHFVGKRLVLVDAAAGLVVDFTNNVLP
jgi:hypothetical protein